MENDNNCTDQLIEPHLEFNFRADIKLFMLQIVQSVSTTLVGHFFKNLIRPVRFEKMV